MEHLMKMLKLCIHFQFNLKLLPIHVHVYLYMYFQNYKNSIQPIFALLEFRFFVKMYMYILYVICIKLLPVVLFHRKFFVIFLAYMYFLSGHFAKRYMYIHMYTVHIPTKFSFIYSLLLMNLNVHVKVSICHNCIDIGL